MAGEPPAPPPAPSPSMHPSAAASPSPAGSSSEPEAAVWFLEWLLLQPYPPSTLSRYLRALPPLPLPHPIRIVRLIYLRALANSVRTPTIATLSHLNVLYLLGAASPELFISAYSAVALHVASLSHDDAASLASRLCKSPFSGDPKIRSVAALAKAVAEGDQVAKDWAFSGDTKGKAVAQLKEFLSAEYDAVGPPLLDMFANAMTGEKGREFFSYAAEKGIMEELKCLVGEKQVVTPRDIEEDSIKHMPSVAPKNPISDAVRVEDDVDTRKLPGSLSKATSAEDGHPPVVRQLFSMRASLGDAAGSRSCREPGPQNVNANASQDHETSQVHQLDSRSRAPRTSLMERNSTARSYEWNESDLSEAESSQPPRKAHQSHSPRRQSVPLRIVKNKPHKVRRKTKKWTQIEEETLRRGVQEHGRGRWKAILESYPEVFEDRTETDLKDKWRNLRDY